MGAGHSPGSTTGTDDPDPKKRFENALQAAGQVTATLQVNQHRR